MEPPKQPERERIIIVWIFVHWVVTTIVCMVLGLRIWEYLTGVAEDFLLLIVKN